MNALLNRYFYKFCYCYHKFSQNRIVEQQNQNPLFIMGQFETGSNVTKCFKISISKNDCKKISMHSFLKGYLFWMLFIFKPHLFYKHKIIFHRNALNSEIMSAVQRVSFATNPFVKSIYSKGSGSSLYMLCTSYASIFGL